MLSKKEKEEIVRLHEQHSIYTPWSNKEIFHKIIDELAKPFEDKKIDKVLGVDSRGFVFAAAVAYRLKAGFIVVRKKNSRNIKDLMFGYPTIEESFTDYSNQKKTIIIENNPISIQKKDKILVIDDWFGTGAHGEALLKLIKKINRGKIVGMSVIYNSMNTEKENYIKKHCAFNYLVKYIPHNQSSKFLFSFLKIKYPK